MANQLEYLDYVGLARLVSLIKSLPLPEDYAPSDSENEALEPKAGDTHVESFAKLHKAILDNEIATVAALNECKTYIKDIVDNMDMSGGTLSEFYVTSEDSHEDLRLQAGNSFEIAFSKLEKAILDNEYLVSEALIDMDNRIRRIEAK